jgi:hypothetical protein
VDGEEKYTSLVGAVRWPHNSGLEQASMNFPANEVQYDRMINYCTSTVPTTGGKKGHLQGEKIVLLISLYLLTIHPI